jgi:hypothetical protein
MDMKRRFVVENCATGEIVAEGGVDEQERIWWRPNALPVPVKQQIEGDILDRGWHQGMLAGYQWLEIDETTVIKNLRRIN